MNEPKAKYTSKEYDDACVWYDVQDERTKKYIDIIEAGDPWMNMDWTAEELLIIENADKEIGENL